jgi:hypothetical protein
MSRTILDSHGEPIEFGDEVEVWTESGCVTGKFDLTHSESGSDPHDRIGIHTGDSHVWVDIKREWLVTESVDERLGKILGVTKVDPAEAEASDSVEFTTDLVIAWLTHRAELEAFIATLPSVIEANASGSEGPN